MPLPRLYTRPNATRPAASPLVIRGKANRVKSPTLEFKGGAPYEFLGAQRHLHSRALKQFRSKLRGKLFHLSYELFLRIFIQFRWRGGARRYRDSNFQEKLLLSRR